MADGLQIKIGADVSQAVAGLKQVDAAATKSATTLQKMAPSVSKATGELAKLPGASNQATQALTNLSRVAQDAPYGFIGIANNLNPLLESFQRLKASTGTTGGALKALGKELTGAGGIGLAIGVVSSLLVVFGDRLFGSSKKAKETADELKKVKDVISEVSRSFGEVNISAGAGVADEIAKVSILSKVVQDQTKSYKERNNALEQLKSINKNYFGDLTLESSSLATLTTKVNEYTNALIAAAVVKEFSSDIAKTSVELSKQLNSYNQLNRQLTEYNNQLSKTKQTESVLIGSGGGGTYVTRTNKDYTELQGKIRETNKQLVEQGKVLGDLSNAARLSREGLAKAIEESLKFKPLTSNNVVDKDSFTDAEKRIIAFAKQIQSSFETNSKIKFDVLDDDKTILDKAKKTVNSLNNFFTKPDNLLTLKINAEVNEIKPPPDDETKVKAGEFGQVFYNELKSYFKRVEPIDVSLIKAVEDYKKIEDLAKGLGAAFENLKQTVITDGISGIAEGIGEALAGGNIGNAFKAFGNVIAGAVTEMGKQFIKLGVAALLAKKAITKLFLNPGLAIAAGAGLVIAGAALKNALSGNFGGFRAKGGPVSAGKAFVVGEEGPEVFTPSVSGSIIPNNRVGSFMGGGFGSGFPTRDRQYIRGNNLVLVTARTNRSQSRLG